MYIVHSNNAPKVNKTRSNLKYSWRFFFFKILFKIGECWNFLKRSFLTRLLGQPHMQLFLTIIYALIYIHVFSAVFSKNQSPFPLSSWLYFDKLYIVLSAFESNWKENFIPKSNERLYWSNVLVPSVWSRISL